MRLSPRLRREPHVKAPVGAGLLLGGRADSLTSLRWFAAFGVFCFHTAPALAPLPLLYPLMRVGYEGVPFFFVLSGFVLTWSARSGDTARQFYVRRFARVWPLLAASLIPALLIARYWTHQPFSLSGLMVTLTLTQAWTLQTFYTVNIVTWTLSVEAFFYLVHPLLMRWLSRLRPPALLVLAAVMVAITAVEHVWPGSDRFTPEVVRLTNASPLALTTMFVTGMCAALAVRQGWRPRVSVSGAIGLLAVVVVVRWRSAFQPGLIPGMPPGARFFDAVVMPFFALLIAAAALRDASGARGVLHRPVLVKLGEWSFAFYIVHAMVLTAFYHYVPASRLRHASDHVVLGGLLLAACISVAAAAHLMVEAPADRFLRRLLGSSRPPAASGPAASVPAPVGVPEVLAAGS